MEQPSCVTCACETTAGATIRAGRGGPPGLSSAVQAAAGRPTLQPR